VLALVFIDGNELRAAQIREVMTGVELTFEALQTGFSTSAPEPAQRARDKVLAHPVTTGAFAEADDLTTMDGKSLRLELDSENANRFCKWWRETPVRMHLVVALRLARDAQIELFTATCDGRIADRPAGPLALGWDRLFIPDGEDATLAQLIEAGEPVGFRRDLYAALDRALRR
jgi:inosine/xanthosine triphosphate pyrophosphatase family protein